MLSHLNKARILAKRKAGRKLCHSDSEEAVTHVRVLATSLAQYQVSLIHSAPRISLSVSSVYLLARRVRGPSRSWCRGAGRWG